MTAAAPLALIDHHVHGVVTADLDRPGFELLLTEAPGPPAPGTTMFDSQLGFAVRRWCAPVLDLEPSAPPAEYLRRRAELGAAEVNRRLLTAAGVAAWLVDTGYQGDLVTPPAELAAVSAAPVREIIRLEAVAERVARSGPSAAGFADVFGAALADATAAAGAVGYKSIAAYRSGFDFDPARPGAAEVAAAAGRLLRALAADPAARVADPVLLRHLIWTAVDTGLPLQFHCGFGDPDVRLHREAGYLANVFPHVYLDVGMTLNHVGARSAAVLAEALELTPFSKMLYSSDAFGLPELHYLGAIGFRRDIAAVTGGFVAADSWSAADAQRVCELIGSANAARVYRLGQL